MTGELPDLSWDDRYPLQATLRAEIDAMRESFVGAVLAVIPAEVIHGIYLKGSTCKPWNSPIDYVPELGDVDVHVLFRDETAQRYLEPVAAAIDIGRAAEASYRVRVARPVHVPRVQFLVLNWLLREPDYMPAPPVTEIVVFGQGHDYVEPDYEVARHKARTQLLEGGSFLEGWGLKVVDHVGKHLWPVMRSISWRVSPSGPRALELLGVPYGEAWTMNRTAIARRLRELGELQLADDYAAFYLHAWESFLSGYADTEAMRRAILAGARVLHRGGEIAASPGNA